MTDEEYRVQVSLGLLPSPQDIEECILAYPRGYNAHWDVIIDSIVIARIHSSLSDYYRNIAISNSVKVTRIIEELKK